MSLCRTSLDARRDRRKGRIRWLTLPIKGMSRTWFMSPASRRTLTTMQSFVKRRIDKTQARWETLTREQYLQVNRKHLLLISFEIKYA
jgi:hypothetical protein